MRNKSGLPPCDRRATDQPHVNLLEHWDGTHVEQPEAIPFEENIETNLMVLFDLQSGHAIVWSSLLTSSSNSCSQSRHLYS
jgi:hypothetical protein